MSMETKMSESEAADKQLCLDRFDFKGVSEVLGFLFRNDPRENLDEFNSVDALKKRASELLDYARERPGGFSCHGMMKAAWVPMKDSPSLHPLLIYVLEETVGAPL